MDDEKYRDLRRKLFDDPNLDRVRTNDLNGMSTHLREYSAYSALNRDYDEAKRSDALLDNVRAEIARRSVSPRSSKEDKGRFEHRIHRRMHKHEKQVVAFNDDTSHRKEQMLSRQNDEMQKFEKLWRDEMPRKYRKLSPKLLTLLASEKMCVRTGDYDAAKSYKIEADKLMKIEMAQAQAQLNADYKRAKEKIVAKHQEELERLEQIRSDQKVLLVSRQKQQLNQMVNRQKVLVIKRDERAKEEAPKPLGTLTHLMQSGGLEYETLLPPLIPPNDERMIEHEEKVQRAKQKKREKIKVRLEKRQEEKERKLQELQERYEESLREERKWRAKRVKSKGKHVVFATQPDVVDLGRRTENDESYSYEEEEPENEEERKRDRREYAEYTEPSDSYSEEETEYETPPPPPPKPEPKPKAEPKPKPKPKEERPQSRRRSRSSSTEESAYSTETGSQYEEEEDYESEYETMSYSD